MSGPLRAALLAHRAHCSVAASSLVFTSSAGALGQPEEPGSSGSSPDVCAYWLALDRLACATTHTWYVARRIGVTIRGVQDILGHSDLETALVYTHGVSESKRRAVEDVGALLFPSVPPQGAEQEECRKLVKLVEKKEESRSFGEPGRTRTCNPLSPE